jgi:D-methionine transport system permease protein
MENNIFIRLWNVLAKNELVWNGFKETIKITLIGCFTAFFIGLILGVLLYLFKIQKHYKRYWVLNSLINFFISTPFLILIVLLLKLVLIPYFDMGYGFGTAFFFLVLVMAPLFARHCEQVFLTTNPELYQISYSLGASKFQFVTKFLLIETRSDIVFKLASLFITSLAYSSVLGIVGHQGIAAVSIDNGYNGHYDFEPFFTRFDLIIVSVLLTFILTQTVYFLGNLIAFTLDKR